MMTSQVLLGVSLFLWLVLDVHGFSVKGLQSPHKRSGGTSAEGNVASRRAGSDSSGPAGVFMQQPQSVQPVFGVGTLPAAGYAAGSVPAGYYSGASYMPGSAAGSAQAAAGQSSLPEARWTIAPEASNAQPQGSSDLLPPPPGPPSMTLQSGETSNVVKEAELGSYQQQTAEFAYPAGRMGPGQSLPLAATPSLGVGGLWGYSSPYPHPYSYPYPYPYFDYRLLYGLYPPGTYTTLSRNHEKGTDYYRPATIRANMALMLHKCPRTLELANRRSNQMRT